jgi:uncharacterized protein YegP (UPF0339 family)
MADDTYQFELYKSHAGYRFRLKDTQGNTVGASPEYRSKGIAMAAIGMLKQHMPTAAVADASE